MDVVIRKERPEDYRKVEEVAREAFWNLYFPGCAEHFVIHKMREEPEFLPDLTFVIEVDGEIVGSIFYTRSKIVTEDRGEVETITFGPVSILPTMHRRGLGKRLIEHSIAEAKAQGHRAILTLGYPYHYAPYGFTGGKKYGISMPDGKFYKGLLVLPLYDGALEGISGYAQIADVLDDPDPDELEAFDRQFPPKEKGFAPSQEEYERTIGQLDE